MSGKTVLITGASSDIGMGFINGLTLCEDDVLVAHYGSSKDNLEKMTRSKRCLTHLLQADFSDKASLQCFISKLGNLKIVPTHILHLSAIPVELRRFKDTSRESFEKSFAVQVLSIAEILRFCLPKMAKNGSGNVIFTLSSCTIGKPPKFLSDYVAVKYALLGLMKALVSEYRDKNIRFNAISPSMVETKFLKNINEKAVEQSAMQNPMARNAMVEDVVSALIYLVMEESKFINGVNLPITGGSEF